MNNCFKFFLICTIIFFSLTTNAQVTNTESFDGTAFPPVGWQQVYVSGSYNFDRQTAGTNPTCTPHSGSGMARWDSYDFEAGNSSLLITPPIDLSLRGTKADTVGLWVYRDGEGYSTNYDSLGLYFNTSAGLTGASYLGKINRYYTLSPVESTPGWKHYYYIVPPSFKSTTNYFIIRATSQYGENIFFDDVSWQSYSSPMTFVSSTAEQASTANSVTGGINQEVIRLKITTSGSASPLGVNLITFSTAGSTSSSDITKASVYYSASPVFSASTQFGSDVSAPNGSFAVSGSQTLINGDNYFWLAFDVSSSAVTGDVIDGQCLSFRTTDATVRVPSVTNPAGSRTILTPMAGIYNVGASLFKKVTGLDNLTFERRIRKTLKPVLVDALPDKKRNAPNSAGYSAFKKSGTNKLVDEFYFVPVIDGKEYTGSRFHKFTQEEKSRYNVQSTQGAYLTLTDAAADLNIRGTSAPVVFYLVDNVYQSETLPINIAIQNNKPADTSGVTIKPASGTTVSITGSIDSDGLIEINSDYITIDGSNSTGTRDLTITNISTSNPSVFYICSNGTTTLSGVTVQNCIINNGSSKSSAVLISDDDNIGNPGYFNMINIYNNAIKNAWMGVYSNGLTGYSYNINIIGNDLSFNGTDAIGNSGLYIAGFIGGNITSNTIANFDFTLNGGGNGIWLATGTANFIVEKNTIYGLHYKSGGGLAPHGILVSSSSESSNILVRNNLIYDITGDGYDYTGTGYADNPIGILAYSTQSGVQIYNNSIYLFGNTLNQTNALSSGIYLGDGTSAQVVNNCIVNNLGLLSSTGYGSAAVGVRNTAFLTASDYNVYCSGPSGSGVKLIGKYGVVNGSGDYSSLSSYKSFTTQDNNSYSGDPGYTSASNLIPNPNNTNSWILNGTGYPTSLVPSDFSGTSRSTSVLNGPIDIGAYEFTPAVSVLPSVAGGIPSFGSTTLYTFGNRTIASITWGSTGTLPSSVAVTYNPGSQVPGGSSLPNSYAWWNVSAAGGSGYSYDLILNYNHAVLDSITENNLCVVKSTDNGSTWIPFLNYGVSAGQYQLDTSANTMTLHGISGSYYFTLTDSKTPLPVELNTFSASIHDRNITLNWDTKTEVNTDKFIIEYHQSSMPEWESLGEVKAGGNSNVPVKYSFSVSKLNQGNYDFRLKIVDKDGTTSFSKTIELSVGLPKDFSLSQNYPNPFNPTSKIDYQLSEDSKVTIELLNITGQKIADIVNRELTAGYYSTEISSTSLHRNLASGVYFYRMVAVGKTKSNSFVNIKKMILMK